MGSGKTALVHVLSQSLWPAVNLAVVTLGFAAAMDAVVFNLHGFTGGTAGLPIPAPRLPGLSLGISQGRDYPRVIFSDDFSSNSFGPRWGHYKSSSVVKDSMLVGITGEGSDHSAVDNIKFDGERDTIQFAAQLGNQRCLFVIKRKVLAARANTLDEQRCCRI